MGPLVDTRLCRRFMAATAGLLTLSPGACGLTGWPPVAAASIQDTCVEPPSGLISWWAAENNAEDREGVNPGTRAGSAVFDEGVVGGAFAFDGAGMLMVPDSPSLRPAGSLTLEAWVLVRAFPRAFAPIISKWNDLSGDNRGFFLAVLPDGRVRFDVSANGRFSSSNSASAESSARLQLGIFNHLAGTFDADSQVLRVFVNGIDSGRVLAQSSIVFPTREPLLIGAGDLGGNQRNFTEGLIDEATIYGRALASEEIAAIFAAGSGGKCH